MNPLKMFEEVVILEERTLKSPELVMLTSLFNLTLLRAS
jgi:hypothetical protein